MLGSKAQVVVVLGALAGALASSWDFVGDMQSDFKMGILPRQDLAKAGTNLQSFQGALGGAAAPQILATGQADRPFSVDGDTFTDFGSATNRACDNQKNSCAEVANSKKGSLTVGDCDQQNTECKAQGTRTASSVTTLVSSNADFDFFCQA